MCEYPDEKKGKNALGCCYLFIYLLHVFSTYLGQPHRHVKLCNIIIFMLSFIAFRNHLMCLKLIL